MRIRALMVVALLVTGLSGLGACDDSTSGLFDPIIGEDTVDLAIPLVDPDVPTALDVAFAAGGARGRYPELPADAEAWDVAIRREGDQLVFLPAAAFQPPMQNPVGGASTAALTRPLDRLFDDVVEAPSFAQLVSDEAVPIHRGGVYVVRSRRIIAGYSTCENYAKVTPIVVDATAGTLTLRIVGNARCNDPRLADEG